jgi:dihydroorotase/N-acyl-D-amino-acid deacylase
LSGLLLLAGCAASNQEAAPDIALLGGTVFSGNNEPGAVADVWIRGDRVVAVGDLGNGGAALRVDASGMAVAPGFIDIHSHAVRGSRERSGLFRHPDVENYIRQGVTTVIGGPDGGSWWPISNLLTELEAAPTSVNFGTFIGHNTIREQVMQRDNRAPTTIELETMKDMVDQGMREGAYGLSTGLKYLPGTFSRTEEVIELARVAGRHGGIHISHMREEGMDLLKSVEETIRIGEEGGLPTQLTHHKVVGKPMWGKSAESLALVEAARERGVDVSIDQYPYTASSTGLGILLPGWSQAGGQEALVARLQNTDSRSRIKNAVIQNLLMDRGGGDPSRVVLADCDWNEDLNGKSLADLLRDDNAQVNLQNAAELVMELMEMGGCMSVFHAMSEQDVVHIMQHPQTMIGSDGGIHVPGEGVPHPRNYGAFARVLNKYVREDRVLALHAAIHKMTRMPAERIGLSDRGRIEAGAVADIVVFDPQAVRDTATFTEPHQYAEGVVHVFIAGTAVLSNGAMTGARPGHILKSTQTDR